MQLPSLLLLISTLSLPLLVVSAQSGAGPHVGSVPGRKHNPNLTPHKRSFFSTNFYSKRHHGSPERHPIQSSSHITKDKTNFKEEDKKRDLSVIQEAEGLQSAVYQVILSISSGLGSAEALIGVKNVGLSSVTSHPSNPIPEPVVEPVPVQAPPPAPIPESPPAPVAVEIPAPAPIPVEEPSPPVEQPAAPTTETESTSTDTSTSEDDEVVEDFCVLDSDDTTETETIPDDSS